MDIQGIKERLAKDGTQLEPEIRPPGATEDWSINAVYKRSSRTLSDALLWIIEYLEQAYDLQVARLEPGDVLVYRVPEKITELGYARLRETSETTSP